MALVLLVRRQQMRILRKSKSMQSIQSISKSIRYLNGSTNTTTTAPSSYLQGPEFRETINIINDFDSSQQILQFLSTSCPHNTQLWGHSIQTAIKKFHDIKSAKAMMEIMYSEDIKRTVITYNNLFTGLVKVSGGIDDCLMYFDRMIDEDGITPNSIICGTVARGIRIENDEIDIDLSKMKRLEVIIKKYDIKPDVLCFSELIRIYVKTYKLKKAYSLWKGMWTEYTNGLKGDFTDLPDKPYWKPFMSATTDVMNGFSANAEGIDIRKMLKIWILLTKELGFIGDRIIYGVIMKGLLNHYEYAEDQKDIKNLSMILLFWKEMVNRKGIHPDYKNFHFISRTYLKIIEHLRLTADSTMDDMDGNQQSSLQSQIAMCLNKLMYDIPTQRVRYGLKENDHILARYQFQAMCLVHCGSGNEHKVDKLFGILMKKNKIGISIMEKENEVIVDWTDCEYESETRFLLRYLMRNYKEMLDGKELKIITGKIEEYQSQDFSHSKYHQQKVKRRERLTQILQNVITSEVSSARVVAENDNLLRVENLV